jgi:hypothetical protein
MSRYFQSTLLVALTALCLIINAPADTEGLSAPQKHARATTTSTKSVSYGGVSFTYNTSLATRIKSVTIPESNEGKPGDVVPRHPSFTLIGYPALQDSRFGQPEIKVFSIKRFRAAMAIASKEGNSHVVYPTNPPEWTTYFDEEVRVLKALLAAKPASNVRELVARSRGEEGCSSAMPFLPMWEACQAFVGRVRFVDFKNGQGVFFLTQWDTETSQISNTSLEYAYQGITNDGRYWIYAEFSVRAPFLPTGVEPEVMAWNEKNYLLSHKSEKYQDYLRPVLAQLEALPADRFQPNLELLERLIASLEVRIDN